jgi:hypothetical protein
LETKAALKARFNTQDKFEDFRATMRELEEFADAYDELTGDETQASIDIDGAAWNNIYSFVVDDVKPILDGTKAVDENGVITEAAVPAATTATTTDNEGSE